MSPPDPPVEPPISAPSLALTDCAYTSQYCEENVYKLLERMAPEDRRHAAAVFVASRHYPDGYVPFFANARSQRSDVFWDYHVFAVVKRPGSATLVYDFDSRVPFPCTMSEYAATVLQTYRDDLDQFERCYRVVAAPVLLKHFASDRSHMLKRNEHGVLTGGYLATPPGYPPIQTHESTMNLLDYLRMSDAASDQKLGTVYDERAFCQLYH
ncbi:Protein N-terminal glutamine amidohydrolase [Sorochytrium milnesiophthora]